MNKLFISFSFLFLGFILLSCDETTVPVSLLDDKPAITQISINPQNQPDIYNVKYYATDRGGLVSDTVETIFRISE